MAGEGGLSGAWTGVYSYEAGRLSVPFNAQLEQSGASFTGAITEPDTLGVFKVVIALSVVDGLRDGSAIQFRKTMTNGHPGHVIHYEGALSGDESRIAGRWRIPPRTSGSFFMQRERPANGLAVGRAETVRA